MKRILIAIALLFLFRLAYASYIFNPKAGGPTTLTDANGCVWSIGSTINTSGVISTTLISCPGGGSTGQPMGLLMAITHAN